MASNNQLTIQHFADPHHPLEQTQYRHDEAGLCNICLLKFAGLSSLTYGRYTCNIHLHSACARYFQETISFFAHPAHTLTLRRSPGRICDMCRGDCPRESFVYSCTAGCGFDVHPLCSMLPERVASPFDQSHQLCMFSSESPGSCCSACHHPLPRWHYIGSSLKLHIACAIGTPTGAAAAGHGSHSNGHATIPVYGGAAVVQGSHGAVSQRSFGAPSGPFTGPAGYNPVPVGSYYYVPPVHGIYYYGPAMPSNSGGYYGASGGQQSVFHNPSSLMSVIARFLLGTAISAVANDLLSELLAASLN